MILSDIAIKAELDSGRLIIVPSPLPEAISTAVIDLHLSNRLRIPKTGMSIAVQLDKPDVGVLQNQRRERY